VLRAQQKAAVKANGIDGGEGSGGENSDDAEGEEGAFHGVATLDGRTKNPSKSTNGRMTANSTSGSASTTEASGAPLLLNPDLPHLAAVLDKADVVIEILDARDPLAHRSKSLEIRVASKEGQKLLVVLNKIGACSIRLLCSMPLLTVLHRCLPPRVNRSVGCPPAYRVSDITFPRCLIYAPACGNA
jgi:nuclear GTP-binding protein